MLHRILSLKCFVSIQKDDDKQHYFVKNLVFVNITSELLLLYILKKIEKS